MSLIKLRNSGQAFFPIMLLPDITFLTRNLNKNKENNYLPLSATISLFDRTCTAFLKMAHKLGLWPSGEGTGDWLGGSVSSHCVPGSGWLYRDLLGSTFQSPWWGKSMAWSKGLRYVTLVRVKMAGFVLGFRSRSLHVQVASSPLTEFLQLHHGNNNAFSGGTDPEWGHSCQGPKPEPDHLQCRPHCCCTSWWL